MIVCPFKSEMKRMQNLECLFQFNRYAQDDTTYQRSAATAYTNFEEQT